MYQITREELVKMINKETNLGFKRVLQNHLRVMDGLESVCASCVIEPVEEVTTIVDESESDEEAGE